MLATYSILRRFSETTLAKHRKELDQLITDGHADTAEFRVLQETIEREERALQNGGGGAAQFPFINHDDFAFPIYQAKRTNGQLITASVQILPYQDNSFEPPWCPRIGNDKDGWTALDVPQAVGEFRPSGPQTVAADGNIILYDPDTKTEYDFGK